MTRHELNRAVARATGETVSEIRRRGFSLIDPDQDRFELSPPPVDGQMIDWDQHDLERNVPLVDQPLSTLCSVA
ncbi:MAG: hypothetical protein KDA75_00105 [Planctomycetaceae bacterium]|nr:hypothetical protein [Planctomycetaceae bacterium]